MTEPSDKSGSVKRKPVYGDRNEDRSKKTPPLGNQAIPEAFNDEECTGRYEGAELQSIRSRRDTKVRVARLEQKHDELTRVVTDTRLAVSGLSAKADGISRIEKRLDDMAEREQATFAAKVEIDTATQVDQIAARKALRDRLTHIIGGLFSAGVIGAVIHWLMGRL